MNTQIQHWVRFTHHQQTGFGRLIGEQIHEYAGDLFGSKAASGRVLPLGEARLLRPVQPGKVIALWNNFAALGAKLGLAAPPEPLYFLKSPNSFADPGELIRAPSGKGKVIFEGELGIVIGAKATAVAEADAMSHVFGYTVANDITAVDVLNRDATFAQWTRAKGMDGFCPMGPCVTTGLEASTLVVKTVLDGVLRQDYPISDMRFTVAQLVSLISMDMTLMPGDVILCGTSIGAGSMKSGSEVAVEIAGIGALHNRYE